MIGVVVSSDLTFFVQLSTLIHISRRLAATADSVLLISHVARQVQLDFFLASAGLQRMILENVRKLVWFFYRTMRYVWSFGHLRFPAYFQFVILQFSIVIIQLIHQLFLSLAHIFFIVKLKVVLFMMMMMTSTLLLRIKFYKIRVCLTFVIVFSDQHAFYFYIILCKLF